MSSKTLNARLRKSDFGSAGSRRIIRNGEIPAVVYGKGEPFHVVVNAREFNAGRSGFGVSTIINLHVADEKDHNVFVKTFQEDLLNNCVRHIDFYEVTADHAIRTLVRIELDGTPEGVRDGGVLDQVIHEIEVECLPKDLPEVIKADVSALAMNESFRVDMLVLPEGVKVIHESGEAVIASVKAVKEEAATAESEDAAAAETDAKTE